MQPRDWDGEDRRAHHDMGRRESDPPGVPLREHLETLIRGVQIQVELEISELARDVRQADETCREGMRSLGESVHKLKGEVAALNLLESQRVGEEKARASTRSWVQWLPAVVSMGAAVYVALSA